MKITFWKGVFVADHQPGEETLLKRAGFSLHEPTLCEPAVCRGCRARIGRRYFSPRVEDATKLRRHCLPRALAVMKDHLGRLASSRAVDSSIVVPAPAGLAYDPYQKAAIAYALQRQYTLLGDEMGLGKDQPLDAKILTPLGWTTMGEVKVGDLVIGSDGHAYPVEGTYPQGPREIYRIIFQDGSSTRCGREHLWEVNTPLRKSRAQPPRILSTLDILKEGLHNKNKNHRHFIRLAHPTNFATGTELPLHPYLVGYLLGNGGLSQGTVRVTIPDPETVERLSSLLPNDYQLNHQAAYDYLVVHSRRTSAPNQVRLALANLGLMGHLSPEKFIPPSYLWTTTTNREQLLQGLIDADGHVRPKDGNIEYSSSSPHLAKDVQQLVWSLGGTAKIRPKKTKRLPSYRMSIILPNEIAPCQLTRKKIHRRPRTKYPPYRAIAKIEEAGLVETKCISVRSPDHLYITDDFILTHNTVEALGVINRIRPRRVLVVCPATLCRNWQAEAEKWLVDSYQIVVPSPDHEIVDASENLLVITNYEKLGGAPPKRSATKQPSSPEPAEKEEKRPRRETPLSRSLRRPWDVLVVDESHFIKNPETIRSQAILGEGRLHDLSRRVLYLSGTPFENYPREIWPVAAKCCPAKFGDWHAFARRYCGLHVEDRGGKMTWVADGSTNQSELQQKLRASIMMRRLKRDVLPELPPKRRQLVLLDEQVDWSKYPAFQRWKELYQRDYEAALDQMEAARTQEEYRAAARALETVKVAFKDVSIFRHQTGLLKLPACLRYTDEMLASGVGSLVIFAHHRDILQKIHEHYGDRSCVIYGDVDMEQRIPIVQRFQEGQCPIFIGGLRAAAWGITLTRASTVVFFETDWNPATLLQAEDRLCRHGQKKMVHVVHPVLDGSLDANMIQKVVRKQDMVDKVLDHPMEHQEKKEKTASR